MRRRALLTASGALLAWALALALWPSEALPRSHATPMRTDPERTGPGSDDSAPATVAERVVVALDDLSAARPRPDLAQVASLLTAHARVGAAHWSGGLTAAQMVAGFSESATVEAASVEHEGTHRARVWLDTVVTITAPDRPPRIVAAPVVVDVVEADGEWLVDELGAP